jgi:hypothetical protein
MPSTSFPFMNEKREGENKEVREERENGKEHKM